MKKGGMQLIILERGQFKSISIAEGEVLSNCNINRSFYITIKCLIFRFFSYQERYLILHRDKKIRSDWSLKEIGFLRNSTVYGKNLIAISDIRSFYVRRFSSEINKTYQLKLRYILCCYISLCGHYFLSLLLLSLVLLSSSPLCDHEFWSILLRLPLE